ncbi:sigma-70 family RNA polymerase sigma factor [Algoriphagus jejuensis]|uniref:Sigma-70 family RNA polymerase sigma factor n=1 Tax=Algoriphagus jejuensis TaxID=419934 RepID=A0ABP3YBJ2_9BACT
MQTQNPTSLNECRLDEGVLWRLLKQGEKEGLEQIYLLYSQELFRYGMAIKPNRSFVKDCIQELFIDLWKYRAGLSQTDSIKNYLFKSLSNKITKEITKDRRLFLDGEISEFDAIVLEESAEEKLIGLQVDEILQKKLDSALAALPIRQRDVIQLLFFEKRSYESISEILGITVDSSYTLAWKAISRLKKSLVIVTLICWTI